ncbi:MAG: methylthioribulose 1-phosphate dehydratase [Spirochaetales bacterium]|nr:methylthioribulose 1-phosphate dehydratase [Leptospiraceae bacterium]MCP5480463.1 methylthioribulose 1-phosphate dehydratase [Spirochaetales bacterium]
MEENEQSEQALREQVCEMCRDFYKLGWVSGTGGGISIRSGDRVYMAPSGVEKEKIQPDDIFVLDRRGTVLETARGGQRLTECAPLFFSAFELRDAGAVLHSHSSHVVLATMLATRLEGFISVLEFRELEMLKGIQGHGYHDTFRLPVIDNTARESELTDSLRVAIERFPESPAVAVRNHGIYIWGPTTSKAKTQAECIDYLCEIKLRMHQLGIPDPADRVAGP